MSRRTCSNRLATAIEAPGRQDATHAEAADIIEVVDLVVDERHFGILQPKLTAQMLEVRRLANARLLVEHAIFREEVIDPVGAQKLVHRPAILRRGDAEHDVRRPSSQQPDKASVGAHQPEPAFRVGRRELGAQLVEALVVVAKPLRVELGAEGVVRRLIGDLAPRVGRRKCDAIVLRPIAERHQIQEPGVQLVTLDGRRRRSGPALDPTSQRPEARIDAHGGVASQGHDEGLGSAVGDDSVEVESQQPKHPGDDSEGRFTWVSEGEALTYSLCCRAVATTHTPLWRKLLPWSISAVALTYVFGFATDWNALVEATRGANLPLYLLFTVADKMIFFLWWGLLQVAVLRRFVGPVSTRELISVRGGAELLRAVNNPVADASFLYGVLQLTHGRVEAVVAVAAIPIATHFFVLLLQATISLAFLDGGIAANHDVLVAVSVSWSLLLAAVVATRTGLWERKIASTSFGAWTRGVSFRSMLPFIGWFALLAGFDVMIQGLASRAFGITIDWWALAGRIPLLYIALALPSFGNYGTREITWSFCFSEFADHDALIAYAFATNTAFLLMHVLIGVIFLPSALRLTSELRRQRKQGVEVPRPLIHDAADP